MRLNRKMNLVVPIDTDARGTVYVHSTPVSREVFERYFLTIAKTFSAIFQQGLGTASGPRVSMLLLRRIAESDGNWDGPEGVERGLVNEMRRLTNVVVSTDRGWQTMPLEAALQEGIVDRDDAAEVDNAVAFFTVICHVADERNLADFHAGMRSLWGAQVVPSDCTAFKSSLATSTETVSFGETPPT